MPRFRLGGGGGGGGGGTGFSLGDGTSVFANNTARNTYFTNNPGRLTQYEEDPFKLITTGSDFQRRSGTSWENVNNILKGEQGDKGDTGDADEYFVLAASVAQTNSNKDITLTITGVTAYAAGQEAIFHTKTGTNGTANARLQINALGYKNLLKEDGTEFDANELEPMTQIRAIYDGTNFLSDFARRSQTYFLDAADVARTGDAYSVTDSTIPGTGIGKPIIIGLKSEADNTGNVTLSVNASTAYPVLRSDGEQIPAGAFPNGDVAFLVFSNVGTVGWHAMNIRPPRKLKGVLVATSTIPVGTYENGDIAEWTLASGITALTVETFTGGVFLDIPDDVPNGLVALPSDRFSNSQLGWFIEITKGTEVVHTRLELFGFTSGFGFPTDTDDGVLNFILTFLSGGRFTGIDNITMYFNIRDDATTTEEYVISLYVTEN